MQRYACRVRELHAGDRELAATARDLDVCEAITAPGPRLPDIVGVLSKRYKQEGRRN